LRSQMYESEAAVLPSFEGAFTQNRFVGATQVFGGETVGVFRTTIQPQLTASWTLYPGGTSIYQILAARRHMQAGEQLTKETLQEQMSGAAQDYYKLLEAVAERDNAEKGVEEVQKQVELNQARIDAGVGIKLDLVRSKTLLAQKDQ